MLGAGEAQGRTGLLAGKVVAVTGAGSGIGRAAAFLTAAEGAAALVITDRNGDGLKETAVQVEERGIEVASLEASIDEAGSPDDLVALAVERFGRLDAAVNNAGVRGGWPRSTRSTTSSGTTCRPSTSRPCSAVCAPSSVRCIDRDRGRS
jgi:NAD(P)-dependent dehydrogenase (short-subunit alcohol dehydrogenase family)